MNQPIHHQVGMKLLQKWHHQLGRVHAAVLHGNEGYRDQKAGEYLQSEFCPRRESQISLVNNFGVVIRKTNGCKSCGGEHGHPYKGIAEVGPKQRGNNDGDCDQHPAHGRRASFFLVRLRSLFADVLADLEFAQTVNYKRADYQSCE